MSEEGLYSQGMTLDHCSIYELKINSDWFDDYEWEKGVDAPEFSLSTEYLSKVLQTRQPSQHLTIEYTGNSDNVTLRFASQKKDNTNKEFPKEFTLSMIEIDTEKLIIPKMEYAAEFGIGSKALQVTNDQLSLFNENLTIHCSEDEIYLRSQGTEGELKVTLFDDTCEHITEFSIEEDLSLTLDFSIKHFNTFCRFLKVSDYVSLSFKEGVPMKFEYIMFQSDNEETEKEKEKEKQDNSDLSLIFYLAPKITY
jgi:proliferating cell nuclear antigen PCNA